MLVNTTIKPSKFRAKHWIDPHGIYNTDSEIIFFLTLQLLVKATITVAANTVAAPDGNDKQIMLTN